MKYKHLAAAAVLAVAATQASAQSYREGIDDAPSAGAMAFDLLVVRPLGVAASVVGVGLFVVQLPLTLFTWNISDPADKLVGEPLSYTFTRELGAMD